MAKRASTIDLERYCPTCEQSFAGTDRCPDDNTQLVMLQSIGDQMIGKEIDGRFTIKSQLGQGGMGTVYRATQHSIGREVAIKVVTPALVTDPVVIKRFLRESKITSRLTHPHAVSVLDFGQTRDGLFFLVMELVEGPTLAHILDEAGTLPISRACRIAAQVCDALDHAHGHDIVHRDLKPSNVMVLGAAGREFCKVLDFGLAKSLSMDSTNTTMTASGALLGTPAYLSPEAAQGQDIQAKGDLYSLGVMLYQMVSGSLPFEAASVHQLISNHAFQDAPALTGVPDELRSLVAQLLRKSPHDRPASAAHVREILERMERECAALPARPAPPHSSANSASPVGFDSTLMTPPVYGGPGLVTQLANEIALANTSLAPQAPEPRSSWRVRAAALAAVLGIAAVALALTQPWRRSATSTQPGAASGERGVPEATPSSAMPADPTMGGLGGGLATQPVDAGVKTVDVGEPALAVDAGKGLAADREAAGTTPSMPTNEEPPAKKPPAKKPPAKKPPTKKPPTINQGTNTSGSGGEELPF